MNEIRVTEKVTIKGTINKPKRMNSKGQNGSGGGWGKPTSPNQDKWPYKYNQNESQSQDKNRPGYDSKNRNYEALSEGNQTIYGSNVPAPHPQYRGFRSNNYYNYRGGGWGRRNNHQNNNNRSNLLPGPGPRSKSNQYQHQQQRPMNNLFYGYGINDGFNRININFHQPENNVTFDPFQEAWNEDRRMTDYVTRTRAPNQRRDEVGDWSWHEKTYGIKSKSANGAIEDKNGTTKKDTKTDLGNGDNCQNNNSNNLLNCSSYEINRGNGGIFDVKKHSELIPAGLRQLLFGCMKPVMRDANSALTKYGKCRLLKMGVDDFDSLSVTDSGVFSDNDGCSSGRSSPVSCKEGGLGAERERFSILTYDQVKRVDSVLNEMVALEGRGNFPALELKLKDLLTAVKDRLVKEGIKIRDIRLNGGAASYALKSRFDFCGLCGVAYQPAGEDGGMICSCLSSEGQTNNFAYNDIDLIFGMELSTVKHFDRVKTAVLDALLDLLPAQVCRKRMSACALKEAYVSKMVKVCEGDRWSLIALGNGPAANSSSKGRSCSVELKFVDTMRRQYEFTVDSFQIVLDSLMLFYKCATVPMSSRFYPTIVGESVFGDFHGALYHLQHGLIATQHPEEIRGGGLLKYCNLLVRGYRPADIHSIPPLQRYMCSRFFIDFPEVEQQESKLRTYLANHMSGVSARLRYAFLITLYHVVDSSTVCLMGHERRLTLQLIQRLACELFSTDCGSQRIYGPQPSQMYHCYSTYYMPQCTLTTSTTLPGSGTTASCSLESAHPAPSPNGTTYYTNPQISASTSSPAVLSTNSMQQNYQSQRPPKSCSNSIKTLRHSQQQQPIQNSSKASIGTTTTSSVPLLTATS